LLFAIPDRLLPLKRADLIRPFANVIVRVSDRLAVPNKIFPQRKHTGSSEKQTPGCLIQLSSLRYRRAGGGFIILSPRLLAWLGSKCLLRLISHRTLAPFCLERKLPPCEGLSRCYCQGIVGRLPQIAGPDCFSDCPAKDSTFNSFGLVTSGARLSLRSPSNVLRSDYVQVAAQSSRGTDSRSGSGPFCSLHT